MTKNNNYYAVIMAGGIGSRFWPVSTTQFPKQFHDMLGTGKSLLQQTFSRLNKLVPSQNILILTNDVYLDITLEQLPQIDKNQVVLEPAMRNTAPCILMAALKIQKQNPDAVMLVAPSDHWIEDETAFVEDIQFAFEKTADENVLMTLGITPTFPNTGYGYIEYDKNENNLAKKVEQFREKPDYETAKQFLVAGNFLWNAGIFIWSVKSITKACKQYLPEMYKLFAEGIEVYNTDAEKGFVENNYPKAENISIDYGIMEKADNVFVKNATFDWNDLGTWGALHKEMTDNAADNAVVKALPYFKNSQGNMVFTDTQKVVVLDDVNNYIVVDTKNALVIFPKEKDQDIKQVLKAVSEKYGKKFV